MTWTTPNGPQLTEFGVDIGYNSGADITFKLPAAYSQGIFTLTQVQGLVDAISTWLSQNGFTPDGNQITLSYGDSVSEAQG